MENKTCAICGGTRELNQLKLAPGSVYICKSPLRCVMQSKIKKEEIKMSAETNAIFDAVVALKPGQQLRLQFETKRDMASKKVTFFRERKKYQELHPNCAEIYIQQIVEEKKNSFVLVFSTGINSVSWLSGATLVQADGTTEAVQIIPDNTTPAVLSEIERLRKLMEEDGKSPEEIEQALSELL